VIAERILEVYATAIEVAGATRTPRLTIPATHESIMTPQGPQRRPVGLQDHAKVLAGFLPELSRKTFAWFARFAPNVDAGRVPKIMQSFARQFGQKPARTVRMILGAPPVDVAAWGVMIDSCVAGMVRSGVGSLRDLDGVA